MKTMLHACSVTVSVALVSGCVSTHPLPDDISNSLSTPLIVQKVRCEAWSAVADAIIAYLELKENNQNGNLKNANFARRLKNEPRLIKDLIKNPKGKLVTETAYEYLNKYYNGAIGYEFTIDITESNTNSIGSTLIGTFRDHDRTFGIGAGAIRQRQSVRHFYLSDTFEQLSGLATSPTQRTICNAPRQPTLGYPISGTIGLKETISSFLAIDALSGVEGENGTGDLTDYTDKLVFTTTLNGNINPTLTFNKVGITSTSPNVGLINSYSRIDKHEVIVSIRIPLGDEKKSKPTKTANKKTAVRPSKDDLTPQQGVIQDLKDRQGLEILRTLQDLE